MWLQVGVAVYAHCKGVSIIMVGVGLALVGCVRFVSEAWLHDALCPVVEYKVANKTAMKTPSPVRLSFVHRGSALIPLPYP